MTDTPESAVAKLWHVGDLSYQLHEDQERVRDELISIRRKGHRIAAVLAARRWGKDRLACTLSHEQCRQQERSQVRYAAPTQKMVRTIVEPHMNTLIGDAPPHLRPDYRVMDGIWQHPNGSQIHVAGTDNGGADRLRGVSLDLGPISEAGFVDDLTYLIQDVMIPQTATTGGFIFAVSSPSSTPAHSFAELCAKLSREGALITRTIHDAPHIDQATREELIEIAGGPESTTARREYFCEFVADESLAVLPEFPRVDKDVSAGGIVEEMATPPYYSPIIVADVGYHDLTFVLGGYYDFKRAVDVIQWEYVTNKTTAREVDDKVSAIAEAAWGAKKAREARRYADAPPMVIAELNRGRAPGQQSQPVSSWGGIAKTQTGGPFKVAAVNDVRTRLSGKSIRIHPQCERLRTHCRYAVWRVPGRDLERMDGYGHFDGVDALAYFVRCLDRATNPYPASTRSNPDVFYVTPREEDLAREQLKKLARRR